MSVVRGQTVWNCTKKILYPDTLLSYKYLYFFTYCYEARAFPSKMASQKCRQNLIF
jgi:hypothetical protein